MFDRLAEKLLGGHEKIEERKEQGEIKTERRTLDAIHYDYQGVLRTVTWADVNVFRMERTQDNECWLACYRPDGTSVVIRVKSSTDLDILVEEEEKKDK